jgi:hypothetical protein
MESPPAVWMASCGGLRGWFATALGGGAETCPATCCRTPNQRSPDLPTGRVSTAGLSTAWHRLPEPPERGSGYLGLNLAKCAQKINVSKINIILCTLDAYFVILRTMCTLSTIHSYCAHSEHTVQTRCTPCAHCALQRFSVCTRFAQTSSLMYQYTSAINQYSDRFLAS